MRKLACETKTKQNEKKQFNISFTFCFYLFLLFVTLFLFFLNPSLSSKTIKNLQLLRFQNTDGYLKCDYIMHHNVNITLFYEYIIHEKSVKMLKHEGYLIRLLQSNLPPLFLMIFLLLFLLFRLCSFLLFFYFFLLCFYFVFTFFTLFLLFLFFFTLFYFFYLKNSVSYSPFFLDFQLKGVG